MDMEERAKAAGVPLVAVLVPNRAQSAMISMGEWPAGYDPYKLDNELSAIVTSHGGMYIDISAVTSAPYPNPEQYYPALMVIPMPRDMRSFPGCWPKNLQEVRFQRSKRSASTPGLTGATQICMDYSIFSVCALRPGCSAGLELQPISRLALDRASCGQRRVSWLLLADPIVFLPLAGFLLVGYAGLVLIERGWSRVRGLEHSGRYLCLCMAEEIHLPARSRSLSTYPYFTLGLSYIFFRVLHLLIETGDGDEKQHIGLGAYLLYTLNFTTLRLRPDPAL